jgi:hypothetical protein
MEDEAPSVVVAWLKDDQSAEDHQRQPDRAHERRSVAPAIGGQATGSQALLGNSTGVARSSRLPRGLAARVGKR